jgi:catechol 2,3-dioxygenase-like lactoylglutathione lyase family enzyme
LENSNVQEGDMTEKTGTRIEEVRTVSVPVTDVDRALEFYVDRLGFEKRLDVPFGDGRHWIEVAAPGAMTTIALSPPGPGQSAGVDTGIRFVTGDVEADHAELRARGVDVDPEILRWPNSPPMFQMRDPDGNLLRVVQRMPETRSETQGGSVLKRFAALVKSDANTESGALPDQKMLTEMGKFNDEMVNAGVMLAGEGLHPSSDGARISYAKGKPKVTRGPFPEPSQLVAGYWVIQARSLDEAIDWIKRAPMGDGEEVEIRQAYEAEEFGEAFTPELREQEERQAAKMVANAKSHAA